MRRLLGNRFGRRSPPAPDEPRILFVHIPKTAGMSLYAALERWAGPRRSIRYSRGGADDIAAYNALPEEKLAQLRLLSGHLSLPDFLRRDLAGWRTVTVLRHPVDRAVSQYAFVRSNPDHPQHAEVSTMGLEAYLDWLEPQHWVTDQQCRMLCGRPDAGVAWEAIERQFDVVGTVERLDAFTDALSVLLGTDLRLEHRNRTREPMDPGSISPAARAHIERMNQQDLVLYDRVAATGLVRKAAPLG